MINRNKIPEPEIKYPTPILYHINAVVEESMAGSEDAARGYVKEIDRHTFIDAVDEIMHADVDRLMYLNLELGYIDSYYGILDRLGIKYNTSAKDSLKEYVTRYVRKLENLNV